MKNEKPIKKKLSVITDQNVIRQVTQFKSVLSESENAIVICDTLQNQIRAAKELPPVQQLFGNMLLRGDLAIVFADTGVGKSIFSFQFANSLASGTDCLEMNNDCKDGLRIVYFDLEMDLRDLKLRYENFEPSPNFRRIDKASLTASGRDIDSQLICDICRELQPDVVFVDNISSISLASTSNADAALEVIRHFDLLKKELGITVVLIDHVPKIEQGKPLTANNLAGSKKMQIFLDSLLAIGEDSADVNCRYIKQLKARGGEKLREVCHIQINPVPYLHFEFLSWIDEAELLPKVSEENPARNKYLGIADEHFAVPIRFTDFVNRYAEQTKKSVAEAKRIFYKLKSENLIVKDFTDGKWRKNENGVLKLNEPQQLNEGDEGDEIELSDSINF